MCAAVRVARLKHCRLYLVVGTFVPIYELRIFHLYPTHAAVVCAHDYPFFLTVQHDELYQINKVFLCHVFCLFARLYAQMFRK